MAAKDFARDRKIHGDMIFCIVLIIVSVGLLLISRTDIKVDKEMLGPFFWPKVALAGLIICGFIKLIPSLRRHTVHAGAETPAAAPHYTITVLSMVFVLGYFLGIVFLGYPLASILFIPLFSRLGGVRKPTALIAISLGLTIITSILFVGLMYVSLPRGEWVFYDLTNFLFSLLGK
jgi:putative tricarboxylic transport membrane protein